MPIKIFYGGELVGKFKPDIVVIKEKLEFYLERSNPVNPAYPVIPSNKN